MIARRPPGRIDAAIFWRNRATVSLSGRCSRKLDTQTPSKYSSGRSVSIMSEIITLTPGIPDFSWLTASTAQRSAAGMAMMNSPLPAAGSRTDSGSPMLL
jgi:hypothetical protein